MASLILNSYHKPNREKRGKLSALYSVEDNDEIEFSPGNESTDAKSPDLDSSDSVFSDQKEEKQVVNPTTFDFRGRSLGSIDFLDCF